MKSLLVGALAVVQEPVVFAAFGAQEPPTYDPTKPRGEGSLANCVVDVGISSIFLGKAGLGINAAVQTCTKNPLYSHRRRGAGKPMSRRRSTNITPMEQATCSAAVSGILSGFLYSASFAALAAADCEKSLKVTVEKTVNEAMCVADVNFILGGMALIAQAGSEIYATCPGPLTKAFRGENWGNFAQAGFKGDGAIAYDSARRLSEFKEKYFTDKSMERLMDQGELNSTKVNEALEDANQKLKHFVPEAEHISSEARRLAPAATKSKAFQVIQDKKVRKAEQAQCAFDVGQATFFLTRAGLMVNSAVQDCSSAHLYEGENKGKAMCSVDVTSIIGAFSFVASGISFAVFNCPAWKLNTDAACAGAIINIVSALAEVAAAGSDFARGSCNPAAPPAEAAKKARRLDEANSTVV